MPDRVLVVHSYHRGYPWVAAVNAGLRAGLAGADAEIATLYMDTKRRPEPAWGETQGARILARIGRWDPDVVVLADDNAQQWVGRRLAGRGRPQVVFLGVNADPARYGYPAANVTGITERPHAADSLALLRRLVPSVQRVALLSDDSPTARAALPHLEAGLAAVELVAVRQPRTLAAWQAAVRELAPQVDALAVYTYHTLAGGPGGRTVAPARVMDWTAAQAGVPVLGFFGFAVDDGALCAVAQSGLEQGRRAGEMAGAVLAGRSAGSISPVVGRESWSVVSRTAARRLGLTLPPGLGGAVDLVVARGGG